MDHDLAYRALASGGADVMDVYTTDAEIRAYALRVLTDDRQFFTRYDAVLLYRADLPARAPAVLAAIERLQGRIDNATMIALNARAKLDRVPESEVAAGFLAARVGGAVAAPREHALASIAGRAAEHSALVGLSLLAAIALAVPLGVVAARRPRIGRVVVGAAGLLQTIPVARAARVADPAARHRLAARRRGAVPLRPAADRQEHARRPGRHPRIAADLGARPRPPRAARACASSSSRWRCRSSSPASRRPP